MTGNISQLSKNVKYKMRRPYKTANTEVGARLEEVIQRIWGSHTALAAATGIRQGTITNYIRHGRLPAGEEMVKLAKALPGQIDYILTGREPMGMDRWRELIQAVPEEFRNSLESYAKILASRDARFVGRLVDGVKHEEEMLHLVRRDYPLPPPTED